MQSLEEFKAQEIEKIKQRQENKILETQNAEFLIELIQKAKSADEVLKLAALGISFKKTGFHFDAKLEKNTRNISYLKRREDLSFSQGGLKHKLIIGDNYPALLNLLISYKNSVKVIYIDPPYGKDHLGEFAKTNYDNAITRDNLLSMLFARLKLARALLREDGVIFCSIDDRNQAYVKCLFDEVFGEENFVADFIRKTKSTTNDAKIGVNYQHEFLLCYAKDKNFTNLLGGEKDLSKYKNPDDDPNGRWVIADPSAKSGDHKTGYFAVKNPYTGKEDYPPRGMFWRFSRNTMQRHIDEGRICFKKEHKENERGFIYKRYLKDLKTNQKTFDSLQFVDNAFMNQKATKELLSLGLGEYFTYPKSVNFIKEIINHATNGGGGFENSSLEFLEKPEIVLDFFAGSGTTAHAVLELNREDGGKREFILVTNNEKSEQNPEGIALGVTTKRLKRIMCGECYDKSKNFEWLKKNEPYKDSLEVSEICELEDSNQEIFEAIDERLYGKDFKGNFKEKAEWVCRNFKQTCKRVEEK